MRIHLFLSISSLLALANICLADGLAARPIGGVAGFDPNAFMLGWEFSTSAPLNVTGLAYLDATGAGLAETHQVGIFDLAGNALVSAVVPAGPAVKLVNGFRIAPVTYLLSPGTYVVGGLRGSNADPALVRASDVSASPSVTYIRERELKSSQFTYPSGTLDLNEKGAFGPSFMVSEADGARTITGVTNSASFQPAFAGGTYISIFGSGLGTTTRTWAIADFENGTKLPASVDGISAKAGGLPAWIEYVSPGQLNIVLPDGVATGPGIPLSVSSVGKADATVWINITRSAPALFTWPTGTADSGKYLVAQHADYSNVGRNSLFPQQPSSFTTPARSREIIVLYGSGFGPTAPAAPTGALSDKAYAMAAFPSATLGGKAADVIYGGIVPGLADIYQVNVRLPEIANGDWPLVLTLNGVTTYPGLITVVN